MRAGSGSFRTPHSSPNKLLWPCAGIPTFASLGAVEVSHSLPLLDDPYHPKSNNQPTKPGSVSELSFALTRWQPLVLTGRFLS